MRLNTQPAEEKTVAGFPYVAEKCSGDLLAVQIAKDKNKTRYSKDIKQFSDKSLHRDGMRVLVERRQLMYTLL